MANGSSEGYGFKAARIIEHCLRMQATGRSKLRRWCLQSGCARASGEEKSRAACGSGCIRTCELGRDTRWEKARSRSIRSRRFGFPDITPELARESRFLGVLDLLKVAKH